VRVGISQGEFSPGPATIRGHTDMYPHALKDSPCGTDVGLSLRTSKMTPGTTASDGPLAEMRYLLRVMRRPVSRGDAQERHTAASPSPSHAIQRSRSTNRACSWLELIHGSCSRQPAAVVPPQECNSAYVDNVTYGWAGGRYGRRRIRTVFFA
jgi:hypothetical protein